MSGRQRRESQISQNPNLNPNSNSDHRLKYNLRVLFFIGWLNIIPFHCDLNNGGRIKMVDGSRWRKFSFWLWLTFGTVRLGHIAIDTLLLALNKNGNGNGNQNGANKFQMAFTAVLLPSYGVLLLLMYKVVTFGHLDAIFMAYNSALSLDTGFDSDLSSRGKGVGVMRMIKNLFLKYLPFFIYSIMYCLAIFMILMPTAPILFSSFVYSKLDLDLMMTLGVVTSGQLGYLMAYLTLVCLDLAFYFFFDTVIYFGVFMMAFFIEEMIQYSNRVRAFLSSTNSDSDFKSEFGVGVGARIGISDKISKSIEQLKVMKLQVLLFNKGCSLIVYCTKLIALTAGIVGGFGAIKLFEVKIAFAGAFLVLFLEGNVIFIIMFDSAYQIGENVRLLKNEIRMAEFNRMRRLEKIKNRNRNGNGNGNGNGLTVTKNELSNSRLRSTGLISRSKEIELIVRSIQPLGIEAGSFSRLERESSLIFVEYVISKIVDLLITSD